MLYWIIAVILVAVAWEPVRRALKKRKAASAEPEKPMATGSPFPCVIEGASLDAPPMADRVKALAIEAEGKKIIITNDYAVDVAKQGGEMMLIGNSFRFTFDAGGQIVQSQSHANVFLKDWPLEGGMSPDGTLGVSVVVTDEETKAVVKLGVEGVVKNGRFVDGIIRKGWAPHIYGILNGTYRKVAQ